MCEGCKRVDPMDHDRMSDDGRPQSADGLPRSQSPVCDGGVPTPETRRGADGRTEASVPDETANGVAEIAKTLWGGIPIGGSS